MKVNESQEYINKLFKSFKAFLDRFYDGGYIEVGLDDEHNNIIRIDCHYVENDEDINALNEILVELQNKQLKDRIKILEVEEYEEYDLAFEDPDTVFFIEIFDNELPPKPRIPSYDEVFQKIEAELKSLRIPDFDEVYQLGDNIIDVEVEQLRDRYIDKIADKMYELIEGEFKDVLIDITDNVEELDKVGLEESGWHLYYKVKSED